MIIDNVRLIKEQVLITEVSVREGWIWIRVKVDIACGNVDSNRQCKVDKKTSLDNRSECERKMDVDKSEGGCCVWTSGC